MAKVRILVTGAAGFIGRHLVLAAAAKDYEVVALSRSGGLIDGARQTFQWAFGQPVPAAACVKVGRAIHLAHDFDGEAGSRRTIESTLSAANQLRAGGVLRQLFFSSYSAGEHAASLYGKTKLAIERGFAGQGDVVFVRPGLVVGKQGIYGRIRKWAQTFPIIPLPDGGQGRVPVISIEELCEWTLQLLIDPAPPREANLFEPELTSLRHLVLEAAAQVGRRPWILPVPSPLLVRAIRFAELLRITLPIKADSLVGFLANQDAQHTPTDPR
ncbi:MAG TPA: NAD-dependent epimerase/dehydratase family protein [Pseudolabrys sp.]|nr:NAD-dependent epimerase/dehydratase family protein [Pseudolabrys sp.]